MLSFLLVAGIVLGQSQPGDAGGFDFASAAGRDLWIRHPVWGDPSFDAFERLPGNPVHRGSAPYLWPVNGFFFEDPPSGDWYLYVGHYLEGYRIEPEHRSICTAFHSTDRGGHWEALGPVLTHKGHIYEGESSPVSEALTSLSFMTADATTCVLTGPLKIRLGKMPPIPMRTATVVSAMPWRNGRKDRFNLPGVLSRPPVRNRSCCGNTTAFMLLPWSGAPGTGWC